MYGPIPIKTAWNWPLMTSYNDFSTYAIVKGGRLPTDPELRLFYDQFESGYEGKLWERMHLLRLSNLYFRWSKLGLPQLAPYSVRSKSSILPNYLSD